MLVILNSNAIHLTSKGDVPIVLVSEYANNEGVAKLDDADLKAIKGLIEVTLDKKLDEKLDEKIKYLPTKEEFYEKMDEVMGELKTIRGELTLLSHRVSNHEDRIKKVENHLGISSD